MTNEKMSRRKFLKTAGIAAGATVFACSGITFAATRQPEIEMTEGQYGKEADMSKKVLVVYGSRAGSTGEVAEEIGKVLAEAGALVDVRNVNTVQDVSNYQAVVLGSAIRVGNWVPEMISFVENNAAALKNMPAAFFSVCLSLNDSDKQEEVKVYMDKPKALLTPASEAIFAGVMDLSKLKLIERLMMKAMKSPIGDFRDWDAIHGWSKELTAKLGLAV